MPRVVDDETLDRLDGGDPQAARSRRDLLRIHRVMGTTVIVAKAWQAMGPARRGAEPLRILELGAGDGRLLLAVARALRPRWTAVQLTLLDRLDIVSPATLAGFAELGWKAQVRVADVLQWAAERGPSAPYELISTTLFLHHFEDAELAALLGAVAARSDHFFAAEPRRAWMALAGSHLVGAMGANAATREDAVLSVRAGFRDRELTALWPRTGAAWDTRERAAGLFSHAFTARRTGGH